MKLYIVRHGETDYIQAHLVQGWAASSLTEKGCEQAKIVAEQLSEKNIDLIISSDLLRTRQTAEIVAKKLNVPLIFDWLLRERALGKLEKQDHTGWSWERYNQESQANLELGIESLQNVHQRAEKFAESLELLPLSVQNLVIVSHNGLINSLLSALDGNHDYIHIDHTEIVVRNFG